MPATRTIAAACLGLAWLGPHAALGQETQEVSLTAEQVECLQENQEKYLNIPHPLIIFSPAFCPYVFGEETEFFAQNSADETQEVERLFLTVPQFSCLVDKLAALDEPAPTDDLTEAEAPAEDAQTDDQAVPITVTLDCPD